MSFVVAVLNLPSKCAFSFDGVTASAQTEDFVGFTEIPANKTHLLTVQGSVTTAFWVRSNAIYHYDPRIEAISSQTDPLTRENCLSQVETGRHDPRRIIPYNQFVKEPSKWEDLSSFITTDLLQRRKIAWGEKLIPGSFDDVEQGMDGLPAWFLRFL